MNNSPPIHDDLATLRTQVALICLKVLAVAGVAVVGWSFVEGDPYRYAQLFAWVLVVGAALSRGRLPDLRPYVLFFTFYLIGITELLSDGRNGSHVESFVLATFFVSALIGGKAVFIGVGISLVTTLAIASLLQNGWLVLPPDSAGLPSHWTGWVDDHLALPLFAGSVGGATAYLMGHLGRSLDHANSLVDRLKDEVQEKENATRMSRESEQMYQLLAENVSDVVFTLTLDLKTVYCSPSVLQQRGFTAEEVIELDVLSSISPETVHVVTEAFAQALQDIEDGTDRVYPLEYEITHKDGHYIWTDTRVTILRDPDGKPTQFLGVSRDVTRRKQAEEAHEELELQFRHIQRIESVGQLAAGVAHDFNNILVAIMGHAELSMSNDLPEEDRENLQEIINSSLRASKLTGQLLAFGRRQIFNLETINLAELVGRLEGMLERLIREDIVLRIRLPNEDSYIEADRGQLEQVIVNLVVNARDAMPNGGELIITLDRVGLDHDFIRQQADHLSGHYARLVVRDHGVGLPTDELERLFEPFFTTKAEGAGTGLGLSVVYGIVAQHHGYLTAVRREDGTDFVVYLPETRGAVQAPSPSETPASSRDGSETILVVEDDEQVRSVVSRMLERAGYQLLLAKDGLEALDLFERHKKDIDLILMDVVMPHMNGKDVMLKIRETDETVPFLFSSGYFDVEHSGFISDYGLELLRKPYERDALLEHVRRMLDARESSP